MFNKKDTTRKWQCFVCSNKFLNYEEYKLHITEEHEEGQDYILCPIKDCNAPVRDVAMHVKVKHPEIKGNVPGPQKAIIWRDFKGDKIKNKKPHFRKGSMISIKNNGKEMKYRSGLECEVYECLEVIPQVVKYDVEPIKGGIPYLHDGKVRHYFPDLSILYENGSIEIWEIKPHTQKDWEINQDKWESAKQFCELRGWTFNVITDLGLGKLKKLAKNNLKKA